MKSCFSLLAAALFTVACNPAVGDDDDEYSEEDVQRFMQSSKGLLPEVSKEEIRKLKEGFNSTPKFQAALDCKVSATDRGHTAGHFRRDDGSYQTLATEPQVAGLKFKIGTWTAGDNAGLVDVFMYTVESKTALELGWNISGVQQPGGHPTLLINLLSTQDVNGKQELLQQHTIMVATNLTPAPVYYTRTHEMRGNDAQAKKFMSVTTLAGMCTRVQ